MLVFLLYLASFALPTANPEKTDLRGYKAAWLYLATPFHDPPDQASEWLCAALTAPTSLVLVAAVALLLARRARFAWLFAGYGLIGQLSFFLAFAFNELGTGYWAWLACGAMLFALSLRLGRRVD